MHHLEFLEKWLSERSDHVVFLHSMALNLPYFLILLLIEVSNIGLVVFLRMYHDVGIPNVNATNGDDKEVAWGETR